MIFLSQTGLEEGVDEGKVSRRAGGGEDTYFVPGRKLQRLRSFEHPHIEVVPVMLVDFPVGGAAGALPDNSLAAAGKISIVMTSISLNVHGIIS